MPRYGLILLLLVVRSPRDMIYYFSQKYFPAHKKQAALWEIYNFVQIKEESLPQAWGRLLRLLNAFPDHPLNKNEILDIFYNGLTNTSKDYLDSCVGCVFRERIVDEAELLLNNMLTNEIIGLFLSQFLRKWSQLLSLFLNPLRRREVFYFSVLKICKRQRNQ